MENSFLLPGVQMGEVRGMGVAIRNNLRETFGDGRTQCLDCSGGYTKLHM